MIKIKFLLSRFIVKNYFITNKFNDTEVMADVRLFDRGKKQNSFTPNSWGTRDAFPTVFLSYYPPFH